MFKKEQKPCNDDDVDDVLLQEGGGFPKSALCMFGRFVFLFSRECNARVIYFGYYGALEVVKLV